MSIEEKDGKDKKEKGGGLRLGPEPDAPDTVPGTIEVPFTDVEEVRVLSLNPGDALVLSIRGVLSTTALERMRTQMEDWTVKAFGRKVHVCVLEEGASIEVLRAKFNTQDGREENSK